jgi:hypothetical protein
MNQELIDMARQADIDYHRLWNDDGTNRLEAFAKLVAAAEREKVAKQWEQWHGFDKHTVAAFIRARGETK